MSATPFPVEDRIANWRSFAGEARQCPACLAIHLPSVVDGRQAMSCLCCEPGNHMTRPVLVVAYRRDEPAGDVVLGLLRAAMVELTNLADRQEAPRHLL